VGFDELFRLHEHAAGAATGVVDAALVGREHGHQAAHHAGRGVELATVLALGAGELGEEVFVHATQDVLGAVFAVAEADGADEVDEFAQAVLVEAGACVFLGQDALEARVVALDGHHGVVHHLADGGLLGVGLQVRPAAFLGHPEDVFGFVLVFVFGVGTRVVTLARDQLGMVLVEGIGDVLEKDEAEDDVLVFRRVHVVAQLVRGQPQLGLETEGGARLLGIRGGFVRHLGLGR